MTRRRMTPVNSSKQLTSEKQQAFSASNEIPYKKKFGGTYSERTSIYRGVNKIVNKEMYEAHVYGNNSSKRAVYLGRFEREEDAARAHDLVSIKYRGPSTPTNFPVSYYEKELEIMSNMTDHEFLALVRRSSDSFSRGESIYRGVAKHTNSGKWQARKGQGKKGFLGIYCAEEEAAMVFDIACIKSKGHAAITNFDINQYDVEGILKGENVPVGQEAAIRLKEASTNRLLKNLRLGNATLGSSSGNAASKKNNATDSQAIFEWPKEVFSNNEDETMALGTSKQDHGRNTSSVQLPSEPTFHLQQYSNFVPLQFFGQDGVGESSIVEPASAPSSSCHHYHVLGSFEPHVALYAGGFTHSSSSPFKPYMRE